MKITVSIENYSRKPLKEEMGKIKYQRRSIERGELVEYIKKRLCSFSQLYRRYNHYHTKGQTKNKLC